MLFVAHAHTHRVSKKKKKKSLVYVAENTPSYTHPNTISQSYWFFISKSFEAFNKILETKKSFRVYRLIYSLTDKIGKSKGMKKIWVFIGKRDTPGKKGISVYLNLIPPTLRLLFFFVFFYSC